MPKDAYFFKHDSNASDDQACQAMRRTYGWEGQGWYWNIIETFRSEDAYHLPLNDMVIGNLAERYKTHPETVQQYIDDCIDKFHLFSKKDGYFFSERLLRDMAILEEKREKTRQAGLISAQVRQKMRETEVKKEPVKQAPKPLATRSVSKPVHVTTQETPSSSLPSFIDVKLWGDFMEMRTKKRVPNTDRAKQLLIGELTKFKEQGHNPNKIIENSIMRGWTGLFIDKEVSGGTHRKNPRALRPRNSYTDPNHTPAA